MCARYTVTQTTKELQAIYKAGKVKGDPKLPRYNIAPSQMAPVIYKEAGGRVLAEFRFGLVPSWSKDAAAKYSLFNARAETLTQKPTFKKSLERRRCLIPADGFYEWRKVEGMKTGTPMHIAMKARKPFTMAGLWDAWEKPDGSTMESYAIITTEPNDVIRAFHHRMPVILPAESRDQWLDPECRDLAKLAALLVPYPPGEMEAYEVSKAVNSPRVDGPQCIAPVSAGT